MKFSNGEVLQVKTKEELESEDLRIDYNLRSYLGKEFFARNCDDEREFCNLEFPSGSLIVNDYGDGIAFDFKFLKIPNVPKMKPLHEGMKLTILEDLEPLHEYGGLNSALNSATFSGQVVTISEIDFSDNTFRIAEDIKGSWFSRGMTKEYTLDCDETIHLGDIVMIIPDLDEDKSYDGMDICEDAMMPLRGRLAKITKVWDNNTKFKIDLDRGRCTWTVPMLIKMKEGKWIFDINELFNKDICIHCKSEQEVELLFNVLNELGVKWGSNEILDAKEFVKNKRVEDFYFEVTQDEKLLYCNENFFLEEDYKMYNYDEIIFDGYRATIEAPFNLHVSKTIKKEELEERGLHLGDIYYMKDSENPNHDGWRIAMNGFSIGLNTEDNKSWSSLSEDIKLEISKIIPFNKPVHRYSNVSHFLKTCDESCVNDMIIKVIC